ncbi:MAG: NAD(P)-dependent oxidoreductase [Nonomuraea sp.]|nr:NAD(P)-dependent oxidoreductase [Nonomuraea sp.]
MRVFVAGGSGVLGRRLVSRLVARGHQVTATTTSAAKVRDLAELGARPVVMDGLDGMRVGEAVAMARPDAIVHQMSAMSAPYDGWFVRTDRLRTEGTDHLLAAAEATGVPHVVARSHASWQDGAGAAAIRHVEEVVVEAGGAALRYGRLYGPGIGDDRAGPLHEGRFPLVAGSSWVHLDDAVSATVLAVERKARGVFDIVDDEPAQTGDPRWAAAARSNARAKRELGWRPRHPSCRQGFTGEPA